MNDEDQDIRDKLYEYAESLTEDFLEELLGVRIKVPLLNKDNFFFDFFSASRDFTDIYTGSDADQINDSMMELHYKCYYDFYPLLKRFENVTSELKNDTWYKDDGDFESAYFRTNFKFWTKLFKKYNNLEREKHNSKFKDYLIPELSEIITNYLQPKIKIFKILRFLGKSVKDVTHVIIEFEDQKYLCNQELTHVLARVTSEKITEVAWGRRETRKTFEYEYTKVEAAILDMLIGEEIPTDIQDTANFHE